MNLQSKICAHLEWQEAEHLVLIEAVLLVPGIVHPQLHSGLYNSRNLKFSSTLIFQGNQFSLVYLTLRKSAGPCNSQRQYKRDRLNN